MHEYSPFRSGSVGRTSATLPPGNTPSNVLMTTFMFLGSDGLSFSSSTSTLMLPTAVCGGLPESLICTFTLKSGILSRS